MIKAIFWDNDGILVDTERLYYRASKEILAAAGIDLTEAMYVALFLVQGRGAWHLAEERGIPATDIARMREERNALYAEFLTREPVLIEGAREVLAGLHGRRLMGVVTSSQRDHFELMHRATGLLPYFDFVLAAGDYVKAKPDPEPYRLARTRSGFPPEECLAVEDSQRGLAAARAAGIRCAVIPSDLTRGGDFAGAYRVLRTIAEVPSILRE